MNKNPYNSLHVFSLSYLKSKQEFNLTSIRINVLQYERDHNEKKTICMLIKEFQCH